MFYFRALNVFLQVNFLFYKRIFKSFSSEMIKRKLLIVNIIIQQLLCPENALGTRLNMVLSV